MIARIRKSLHSVFIAKPLQLLFAFRCLLCGFSVRDPRWAFARLSGPANWDEFYWGHWGQTHTIKPGPVRVIARQGSHMLVLSYRDEIVGEYSQDDGKTFDVVFRPSTRTVTRGDWLWLLGVLLACPVPETKPILRELEQGVA